MLKGILIIVAIFVLNVNVSYARIWRVNNTPGIQADFTTLTNAHDGASSGDTLHVEGSAVSYGGLTCNKKLVIIGPGFFLGENPNTQALKLTAILNNLRFNNGAQGSVVMGLDFSGNSLELYCNDIVIRRNKFSAASSGVPDYTTGGIILYYVSTSNGSIPAYNIVISQNFGVTISSSYACTGVLILNNYLGSGSVYGETTQNSCVTLNTNAVAVVQNNILRRGKVSGDNSSFTNNIMVAGTFDGTSAAVSNNLASGSQFGTASENQANVNMSTVFIGQGTAVSPDGQWKLKPGSPAIGAGSSSTVQNPIDAGLFGGSAPYVLAGLPPVPAIYSFENKPVGSNTDPITVTIKVKSGN